MNYDLVEIDNPKLLAQINSELNKSFETDLAQVNNGLLTISTNKNNVMLKTDSATTLAMGGVAEYFEQNAFENGEKVYRLTNKYGRPLSGELMKSKQGGGMLGSVVGPDGRIVEQAHLHKVSPADLAGKPAKVVKATAATMQVAAVVVGQYYMNEISGKLDGISSNIQQILDFQESELLSIIITAKADLEKIAMFEDELLRDDQIRNNLLLKIDGINSAIVRVNNQANIMLEKLIAQQERSEKKVLENITLINNWNSIAVVTLNLITLAAELKKIFAQGILSTDYVNYSIDQQVKKFETSKLKMENYLLDAVDNLKLDQRSEEHRAKDAEHRLGGLSAPKFFKQAAIKADMAISKRLDYGLDFTMSDEKLQQVGELIDQIVERQPLASKLVTIGNDLNQDQDIVINEGKAYYAKQVN